MIVFRLFALWICLATLVHAQPNPNAPTAETGRDGAKDLIKEALFEGMNKAFGESGGTLVEFRGHTYHVGSGEILGAIDDVIIDPIVDAATTEGEPMDKFIAWLKAASVGGMKVYWPAYGLTVDAGKVVIGGSIYTTEQMIAAVREQQIEAIIFGRGMGGMLGSLNNPLAEQNFLTIPKVFRAGITVQNFGTRIEDSATLRDLWFGEYRRVLVKELLMPAAEVDAALVEGFPRLEEFWKLQRAGIAAERFAIAMSRNVLAAQYRAEQEAAEAALAEAEAEAEAAGEQGQEEDEDIVMVDSGDLDEVFGRDPDDQALDDEGWVDSEELPGEFDLPDGTELADGGRTGELLRDDSADGALVESAPLSGQIFDLVEVKADQAYDTWVVSPGHAEVSGYGWHGSYDWTSPPAAVGSEGFVLSVSVTCQTAHGQRMATGIQVVGGFSFPVGTEAPCNANVDDAQSASLDIRAIPPQQATPGSLITLRIGAFWGLGVTYVYRAR